MKHQGNLEITKENAHKYKRLVEVSGYLSVNSDAKLEAPQLTTIGGDLSVYSSAKLEAPQLTTIGGNLSIYSGAKLEAPQLTTVGGNLSIYSGAKLEAPQLTTVGGSLSIDSGAKLEAPLVKYNQKEAREFCNFALSYAFAQHGLIKADGILSWVTSIIQTGEINLYEVVLVGENKKSFLVEKNYTYAHGETKQEALLDLDFKLGSRDKSHYKSWDRDEQKPLLEMALAYRVITGACRSGVKQFIDQLKDKKKTYSMREVLKLTEGHYGHEEFKEFLG